MDDFENKGFFAPDDAEKEVQPATESVGGTAAEIFTQEVTEPAEATPEQPEATETPEAEQEPAPQESGFSADPHSEEKEPAAETHSAYQNNQQNQGYPQGAPYQNGAYDGFNHSPYQQNSSPYGNQNPYAGGYGYGAPYGRPNYGPANQGGYYGYPQGGYQQGGYQQGGYQQGNPIRNNAFEEGNKPQEKVESAEIVNEVDDKNSKKGKKIFFAIIAVVLVLAIVGGSVMVKNYVSKKKGGSGLITANGEMAEEDESTSNNVNIALNPVDEDSKALSVDKIAEKARESCVGVLVYANANTGFTGNEAGQGTGIIAEEDAKNKCTYILTCAHVIDEGNVCVKIQLENGTVYDAEIVAYDVRTDVGVVKVNQTGLKVAEFGDDSQLKVGSAVYAVGNPGGVEFFGSFTNGIVSAIDRPIDSEIGYTMKCIQHTAAINPGNSGGALVNVYGQVIGINSQKIASTEYEGMGFAIPITQAKQIAEDLINYSYVPDRAKLGITYYSLSASQQYSLIAQINQLPAGTLIIKSISKDSSLANTQAKENDMIIAVDGKELTTADILLEKIDKGHVGDKLKLTLCRVNSNYTLEKFDVEITLVEDKGDTQVETTTSSFYPFGDDFGFGN